MNRSEEQTNCQRTASRLIKHYTRSKSIHNLSPKPRDSTKLRVNAESIIRAWRSKRFIYYATTGNFSHQNTNKAKTLSLRKSLLQQ